MYNKLDQRVDLYTKSSTVNAAGQKKGSWTLSVSKAKCIFLSRFAQIRTSPSYEEIDNIFLIIPGTTHIDYSMRAQNVTDRLGNVIVAGPFQVTAIEPKGYFTGKIRYNKVSLEAVYE